MNPASRSASSTRHGASAPRAGGLFARPGPRLASARTVHVVGGPADVPQRPRPAPEDVFLVPDFATLEQLVTAGVDSARVAVVAEDVDPAWIEQIAAGPVGEPLVPPQPFRFAERLLIVVPTYNERENVERLCAAIPQHIACDVLVVDDGSPDGTGAIADRLAAASTSVHVLHRARKQGLGKAYVDGFRWGIARGYDRLFEMDADFSHAPHDLPRLAHASLEADLVIGSRYVRGGDTAGWTWPRRLVSRSGNAYARFWLGLRLRDMTAGYRCYRTDLLRRVDLDAITTDGYAFQIEMAWRAHRAGGTIRELPVRFVDRRAGKSKMSGQIALEAMRKVPRLRSLA